MSAKRSQKSTFFFKLLMVLLLLPGLAAVSSVLLRSDAAAAADTKITVEDNNYLFEKITNPTAGSGEADGINTGDAEYPANRYNSYAWAVASRGDYIYIGTNRNLFGSALNNTARLTGIDSDQASKLITLMSGGAVPATSEMTDDDYIAQIIRLNPATGETKVIYQPDVAGLGLDPTIETASFRSAVCFNGNIYFGTLGVNMVQIVRVDKDDNAEVVYSAQSQGSSLRAAAVYDDGSGETVYFGGRDNKYQPWLDSGKAEGYMPIVICSMNPEDDTDWSNIVADYTDFAAYAKSTVYANAGGTVWDLVSYNDKLYLILATDGGFAMFSGENVGTGSEGANQYGWKWTEIVGSDADSAYPLGMDASLAGGVNARYPGLIASTATPYVYNGKMYIGTFDNATLITHGTVAKLITRLNYIKNGDLNSGPKLSAIYGPIYEALSSPQKVYVMDSDETITEVTAASELLAGTNIDYVWRFQEYQDKLYLGTFDATTVYSYFLNLPLADLLGIEDLDDNYLLDQLSGLLTDPAADKLADSTVAGQLAASKDLAEDCLDGQASIEKFVASLTAVEKSVAKAEKCDVSELGKQAVNYYKQIKELLTTVDLDGLRMLLQARELVNNAQPGFDLLVSADGSSWEKIASDGFNDKYNYGARTFTVCSDALYLGTANPFYGAQVWKVTDQSFVPQEPKDPAEPQAPAGQKDSADPQDQTGPKDSAVQKDPAEPKDPAEAKDQTGLKDSAEQKDPTESKDSSVPTELDVLEQQITSAELQFNSRIISAVFITKYQAGQITDSRIELPFMLRKGVLTVDVSDGTDMVKAWAYGLIGHKFGKEKVVWQAGTGQ